MVTEDKEAGNSQELDISNIRTLNDFFKTIQDNEISNIIDSVTFDTNSQTIIFGVRNLLKKEAERVEMKKILEDTADEKIIKLSEDYKNKYPDLLTHFKEWKTCRENLVKILRNSSRNLERSSTFVSSLRILTSVADIFGTFSETGEKGNLPLPGFAMKHASTFGIIALVLEMTYAKKKQHDAKKAIQKDQESFKKIVEWFQQTKELDACIRSYFPYGIDKDIVKKINSCSSQYDIEQRIFMSIFASNVRRNNKLFKNKTFLGKAERIATSEAGKHWFNKIILENDPYFQHSLNSELYEDIHVLQNKLKRLCPESNRDAYIETTRAIESTANIKILLNIITMISAASKLMYEEKPEVADNFETLAESTEKELKEIRNIIRLMKPTNLELDPALQ